MVSLYVISNFVIASLVKKYRLNLGYIGVESCSIVATVVVSAQNQK